MKRGAIGLLDCHNQNYSEIAEISIPNRQKYCDKYNYGFEVFNFAELTPINRTPHWGRVLGIKKYLKYYDWIFYCDTDAIILNESIKIEDYIDDSFDIIAGPLEHEGHLSTSGLLIKNSSWMYDFLELWYNQTKFIDEPYFANPNQDFGATGGWGGKFFEQSAFEYLYDTRKEVREKIKRLPRGAFNAIASSSYLYNKGDFLIHFPGVSKEDKLNLMKQWANAKSKY